jgi:5-methylcytosine-specific restriction enzyme A
MARTLPEWIGKTDDSMPPDRVKDRIRERQGNICAVTGVPLRPGVKVQYDHIVPLWLGGSNCERNLQAITEEAHKQKTKAEATVRAKCNRTRKKHLGIKKSKSPLTSPRWKKRMDGVVVDRETGEPING